MFGLNKSKFSLKKSKKIFNQILHTYHKKKKKLNASENEIIKNLLAACQEAIKNKDEEKAHETSSKLLSLQKTSLYKKPFERFLEVVSALAVALFLALVIRQMWFELYIIPSGSMRPTFKEGDFLVVNKADYSINTLGKTGHLYFDPKLVNRGGIIVFSTANMDVYDSDTRYFFIFPGKKQFVKRLIAKPGDTIYFHGGSIYGIDNEGKAIKDFQHVKGFDLEHIPFIRFEGNVVTPPTSQSRIYSPTYIYQMGMPVAKLSLSPYGQPEGEMLPIKTPDGKVMQQPQKEFFDLWGFKNFAMTRILTKKQAKSWYPSYYFTDNNTDYYLELTHHPNLKNLSISQDLYGRMRPMLGECKALIALDDAHMQKIFSHLTTARFAVKNHKMHRVGLTSLFLKEHPMLPTLKNIPNGTYEFFDGKAQKIYPLWITANLSPSASLLTYSPELTYTLFNLGIDGDMRFLPHEKNQPLLPSRYAYFKDGDLRVMGETIFTSNELSNFLANENKKASTETNYFAFIPTPSPLRPDGTIDIQLIKDHGLKIPPSYYLALGDNHAMSGDCRDFGFVPAQNLRGGPAFIFWPPSKRLGAPYQPAYKLLALPNVIIWSSAGIVITILLLGYYAKRRFLIK